MNKTFFNLYGMNIFLSALPYYFIEILLLNHLGFSFTEIATLSVITELFGSVFDIPLSFVAGKMGYKKILVISNVLLILALSCLLFGKSNLVYISAVFFGLSESLSSGVLNAYNFEIIDDEVVYKSFLKYLNTIKYIFIAVITILSPFLLNRNDDYPLIISIVFVVVSLLNLSFLPEIKKSSSKESDFFTIKTISNIPWHLIVLGTAFSTLIMISNSYASIFLNKQGLSLDLLGIVLFLFNISMAVGSYLKIRFEISLLLPLLAIFIFFQNSLLLQIIIFIAMRILNANYNNHFYAKFNVAIENNRAVSWSVYNLCISISFMISDFLAGIFADSFSIRSNFLIFGIVAFLCLIVYLSTTKKQNN
ncbi:MFS transporter [Streptococcus loxodontisalivarius]|uniref:MFS family arabinose efflux permease n=1 Tax=Streptococcus loxodontisalivarius TaxID=1349415 RepID=A0ABS2PRM0_9STRE|nr:MFS transporter [Streptococcus loxodontisalivarius]MBM7642581.1 putative MFS family arabinose efflux permease [Streptococcus loxodontisalivarius]